MATVHRYSDDDLDRIEREAQALLDEAQGTLNRADSLLESVGVQDGKSVSGFLENLGSSGEIDELRAEHIGDLDRELLEEEKRVARETQVDTPASPRRRRGMTRV